MRIDIQQKKISFGDKYQIFTEEVQTHTASTELFTIFTVIRLYDLAGIERLTIRKRHAWFKARYDITLQGGAVLEFRTRSFWKGHYQCQSGNDLYDIYGHKGRKCSIYKNNTQVAWWDKKALTWFEGDNYRILADRDSDSELLITFCLILDQYRSNSKGDNSLTIDFGSIGPQAKKFDVTWQPKP
jgi:uncharacterized protein YxjI